MLKIVFLLASYYKLLNTNAQDCNRQRLQAQIDFDFKCRTWFQSCNLKFYQEKIDFYTSRFQVQMKRDQWDVISRAEGAVQSYEISIEE